MLTSGSVSQDSLSWTQLCWMHKHNMQQISSCNICKMLLNDLPTGSGSHAGSLFFLNSFCPHRLKCLVATLQLQLSRISVLFHLKFDVLKYLSVRKETRETWTQKHDAFLFLYLLLYVGRMKTVSVVSGNFMAFSCLCLCFCCVWPTRGKRGDSGDIWLLKLFSAEEGRGLLHGLFPYLYACNT